MLYALIISIVGNLVVIIGTGWYLERSNKRRREEMQLLIYAAKAENIQEFKESVAAAEVPAVHNFVESAVRAAYTKPGED